MNNLDAWIYGKPVEWDAVDTDPETTPLSEGALSVFIQAKTGYWKTYTTGYEVYNVLATRDQLNEILAQLTDVAHTFTWRQGPGIDEKNVDGSNNTLPAEILAVMKDHITYDQDGNPIGSEAPTYENPNWGHVYFGQNERIFAGEFSSEFSEEFN